MTVTFSPEVIIAGWSKLAGFDVPGQKVNATVSPANRVNDVTIAIDPSTPGAGRAEIRDLSVVDAAAGKIVFYVYGKDSTPVSAPGGDTTIKAMVVGQTQVAGQAQVVVVAPTTYTRDRGDISFANSYNILAMPKRISSYCHENTVVTFYDQFGNVLNSIYNKLAAGAIQERFSSRSGLFRSFEDGKMITINKPYGFISKGVVEDQIGVISPDLILTFELSTGQWNSWTNFTYTPDAAHPYNNAIAIAVDSAAFPATSSAVQELFCWGHATRYSSGGMTYSGAKIEIFLYAANWTTTDSELTMMIAIGSP